MRYEVINHFDVWGNVKDGWEVNNQCTEGFVELPKGKDTELEVLKALKKMDMIRKTVRRNSCNIYTDGTNWYIEEKNGKPVFTLMYDWRNEG